MREKVTSNYPGYNPGSITANTTGSISTPDGWKRLNGISATVNFSMRISGDKADVNNCSVYGTATI